MRILFLCGREADYPLNRFLIDSCRRFAQVDVPAETGSGTSILLRSLRVALEGLPRLLTREYDLVFVSFFGHFLMQPLRLFHRVPILFHPFISTYETLVDDRGRYKPDSLQARLAFRLDRAALHAADHILFDTQANIDWFGEKFGLPAQRFSRIFIASDEGLFHPRPKRASGGPTVVLFHGSYLPLHGIDVILHAAAALNQRRDILFRMVGRGMGYERITKLAVDLGLQNIEFLDRVPLPVLPAMIAAADICLGGHFGDSDKALRVIAGKTFQDLAMGKATIVGDTRANRELLTHRHDAWFVPPSDPAALAGAIAALADDPARRERVGANAARSFLNNASLQVLAPQVQELVERVVSESRSPRA